MTRKNHGLPPQPFHFFRKVYEHIISKKLGFVVLASHQNRNIAGAVFFHLSKKAYFKYGASNTSFHHVRPNNLVMWEAIRECMRRGCRHFSFGRTEPDNKGLLQFKRGWSPEERPCYYYKYDLRKESFQTASMGVKGFHNRIFERMPLPVLRCLGSALYKHIG